jgi:hypothetical protein
LTIRIWFGFTELAEAEDTELIVLATRN